MRTSRISTFVALATLSVPLAAQEPVDERAVEILRQHGLEKSQAAELLSWICDVHGARLTGSKALDNAQRWAVQTLTGFGGQNARREAWGEFGRGWKLERFSMHVEGDNAWPVLAWPKAWSPALDGVLEAEIVRADLLTAEELESADLRGKIVFFEPPRALAEDFSGEAHRFNEAELLAKVNGTPAPQIEALRRIQQDRFRRGFQKRGQMMEILHRNRPALIVDRYFKGDYGTVFATAASVPNDGEKRVRPWQKGAQPVPQVTMAVEHYNRICRMLDKGVKVRLSCELKASFDDSETEEHNVFAEIPGTDPELKDQVVMLGAHFDSWHTGSGATDNGCGSAVMMEAFRLLNILQKELGQGPRRTIRVALWSGEEQGLLGSRNYVRDAIGEAATDETPARFTDLHSKISAYYNLDNGTGKVRGVYLQGNAKVAPIFRAWLRPFHDLDAATLTLDDTGGTDHLAFDRVGLPGFQFIQDPIAYSPRTHHSNMDVWDHALPDDLKQAATIIASFVWHTAQRDGLLPRK